GGGSPRTWRDADGHGSLPFQRDPLTEIVEPRGERLLVDFVRRGRRFETVDEQAQLALLHGQCAFERVQTPNRGLVVDFDGILQRAQLEADAGKRLEQTVM